MSTVATLQPGANPAGALTPVTAAGTSSTVKASNLVAFEGFLKKAGHLAGVVLSEIVKYAIPLASLTAVADPGAAPLANAFAASLKLGAGDGAECAAALGGGGRGLECAEAGGCA